jgi:hypothetical protein
MGDAVIVVGGLTGYGIKFSFFVLQIAFSNFQREVEDWG